MNPETWEFEIGSGQWKELIRCFTKALDPQYWDGFRSCSSRSIESCERLINRKLPDDFALFLQEFGAGNFPFEFGGVIFSPVELVEASANALGFVWKGTELPDAHDLRQFYATHGRYNPAPKLLTEDTLLSIGFNPLNLLQIGTDGSCGYHMLNVGPPPQAFGYCHLDPSGGEEDEQPTFSAALRDMLMEHWRQKYCKKDGSARIIDFIIEEVSEDDNVASQDEDLD